MALLLSLSLPLDVLALQASPKVRKVSIKGASTFSERRLKRLMRTRLGLQFNKNDFAWDIEALLTFYRNEGFLDVGISQREVVRSQDGRSVSVFIEIEEGPRTVVGGIQVEGVTRVPLTEVQKQLSLKVGDPFRRLLLLKDRKSLQVFYAERGMINAEIAYRALQDAGNTATVAYTIQEGEPVQVGEIILRGLDKTRPEVVTRELALRLGDLYHYSNVRKSQRALYRTGLFRSVVVEPGPKDPAKPNVRDLVVHVRERKAGALDAGLGCGTSEGLRVGLSVSQDNWMGRGMQIGFDGRLSRLVRKGEGAFTAPRLLGVRVATDVRIFYHWERNDKARFTTRRVGGDLTLSHRLGKHWRTEMRYLLERVKLLQVDRPDTLVPTRSTSNLSAALTRDTRDDLLDPKRGSFLRGRVEYAGGLLQGTNTFMRPTGSAFLYRSIARGVIWAGKAQARYIRYLRAGEETVEYERFYLGGDRSVRGYERNEIGADEVGNVALSFQTEVRFPLWKLSGAVFLDGGDVWRRVRDIDLADLRYGYGGGIRYDSPFGLLRLDVGIRQGKQPLHRRLEVYLGVGQGF